MEFFKRAKATLKPRNCVGRYLVIKHSWRGSYKRLLCVTPSEIFTQDPQQSLRVTNTYSIGPDADIDGLTVGPGPEEFTIMARSDKKTRKFTPVKFSCRQRGELLTDLYQCITGAASLHNNAGLAYKLLSSAEHFQGSKWSSKKGTWTAVTLQVSCFDLTCLEPGTGAVLWRVQYTQLGKPAFTLLANSPMSNDPAGGQGMQSGVFSVNVIGKRRPKLLSCTTPDVMLQALKAQASKRLGIELIVDKTTNATRTGPQLLQQIAQLDQQAASQLCEKPVAEWEVSKLRPRHDVQPSLAPLATPHLLGRPMTSSEAAAHASGQELGVSPGAQLASRRLVLTTTHIVERKGGCYSLAAAWPIVNISSLIRFTEDPQLLGIEWMDHSPPALYLTPSRDTILAALLDAAQSVGGSPVAVLPGLTCAAEDVLGIVPPPEPTTAIVTPTNPAALHVTRLHGLLSGMGSVDGTAREVGRWLLDELVGRAREVHPVLNTSSRNFFTADIDFKGNAFSETRTETHSAYTGPIDTESGYDPSATNRSVAGVGKVALPPPVAAGSDGGKLALFGADAQGGKGSSESAVVREAVEVLMEAVVEFCACAPLAGVPSNIRLDSTAAASLLTLLPPELQPGLNAPPHLPANDVKQAVLVLQCLQRLAASYHAAETILSCPGAVGRIFCALACEEEHVSFEASRLLQRFMSPHTSRIGAVPWRSLRGGLASLGSSSDPALQSSIEDLELSKAAKALCFTHSLLKTRVDQVLAPLQKERPSCSPLVSLAAVELVAACACEPGSVTTDNKLLHAFLSQCAALGRPLFALFHHPAVRVGDGVAVLMRAIAESGTASAAPMREAALREGAMLHHLLLATSQGPSARTRLSRDLVASWADEYAPALALLRRVLPQGLIRFLNAPKVPRPPPAPTPPPAPVPPPRPAAPSVLSGALPALSGVADRVAAGVATAAAGVAAAAANATAAAGAAIGVDVKPQGASEAAPGETPAPAGPAPPIHPVQAASLLAQAGQTSDSGAAPAPAAPPAAPSANQGQDGTAVGAPGAAEGASNGTLAPGQLPGSAHVSGGGGGTVSPSAAPASPTPRVAMPHHGLRGNWDALWDALEKDHCHAGLVWNESCRRELRDALQAEEMALRARRRQVACQASAVPPSWNHTEFKVTYNSLAKHTCIGGIFIRLLLDGADTSAVNKVPSPRDLFNALHHHLICSDSHLMHAHTSSLSPSAQQSDPSRASLQSSALTEVEAVQLLCVRGMAELYHVHAAGIGAIEGLPHLLRLMDLSLRRPLRHHLLLLMGAVLKPRAAQDSVQAQKAAKANAITFCDEGGVELLVDFAAASHEACDEKLGSVTGPMAGAMPTPVSQSAAGTTHLLTSAGHDGASKEWYYYPNGVISAQDNPQATKVTDAAGTEHDQAADAAGQTGAESAAVPDATGRVGPISKAELLQLWKDGKVHGHTPFWAEGCTLPAPLASIRELRWLVSGGGPVMAAREVGKLALQLLAQLAHLQPATDATGSVLQPLPRVLRLIASPRCLPHLVQVLLTRDPHMVSQAAVLLEAALANNEDVLARLYRTGLFYFTLSYAGSNLKELASLLAASHLKQAHRGASNTTPPGAPLATRSYLGHLLPESLLYCLDTYGPQAFATALCGETDTPELRWTSSMRWGRLLPQLTAHLGDFPQRLSQNWSGCVWSYTPAPPVTYPELKDEVWCHRYYLKALCDEVSFPNWNIVDHVQLLQALLGEWRNELGRQPLALSEADACSVLGVTANAQGVVSEDDMRRAYRNLARKFHPDKNPAGRPMFLKVQQAYERLQAGASGGQGPQGWRIVLVLKAQAILFRRYRDVLTPYKYAGYPMLLEVLSSLNSSAATGTAGFLTAEQGELSQAACELCWRTVCTSLLNADELARCGGVAVIAALFQRLFGAGLLKEDSAPTSHEAIVATHLIRSLAGFAASEKGRQQIAEVPGMLSDVVRCCTHKRANAIAEAALVTIGHLAAAQDIQAKLLDVNVMAYIIPLLFWYDVTASDPPDTSLTLPFAMEPITNEVPTTQPAASSPAQAPATNTTSPAKPLTGPKTQASPAPRPPPPVEPAVALAHSFKALEMPMVWPSEVRAHNYRAMMAAQVLGRVAGVLLPPFKTPDCIPAQQALGALLTHGLAIKLRDTDPRSLLALLNSGQESAQVIWNAAMRDELLSLMSDIRSAPEPTTASADDAAAEGGAEGEAPAAGSSPTVMERLMGWRYSVLQGELQIGGVFVRVYCANPAVLPADVPGFCKALVRYLYDLFVTSRSAPGSRPAAALLEPAHASVLSDTVAVLKALALLLEADSRLLGLLASRSAVSPLVLALQMTAAKAFAVAYPGSTPPAPQAPTASTGPADLISLDAFEPFEDSAAQQPAAAAQQGQATDGPEIQAASHLTQGILSVLSKLVSHAGCMDALADPGTLLAFFHHIHCAPSAAVMTQALAILRALAGSAAAGVVSADQAGALLLLVVLLHPPGSPWPWPGGIMPEGSSGEEKVAQDVAALLSRLMSSPTHGTAITLQMQRLLPPALVSSLASSAPPAFLAALRGKVSTPELVWEPRMASQAAAQLSELAHQARVQQATPGASPVWSLPPGLNLSYQQLQGELCIGGVYCRLFLKDPQYPLKEPLRFGEALAEGLVSVLKSGGLQQGIPAAGLSPSDLVLLLSASVVALIKHHLLVADALTSQGYIPRLLALLAARLPPADAPPQAQSVVDEGGALLRMLHALSSSTAASESMAAAQVPGVGGTVAVLSGARAWGHAAEVLVLETLKRVLGTSNRSRDSLVNQSLQVGLVTSLLSRLDWQAGSNGDGSGDGDLAVLRALAVDVLTALSMDGMYSAQVLTMLDASSVWSAYRGQRHDLFLPSGAAAEGSVAGLLTGTGATLFALPAPERLNSNSGGV